VNMSSLQTSGQVGEMEEITIKRGGGVSFLNLHLWMFWGRGRGDLDYDYDYDYEGRRRLMVALFSRTGRADEAQ
jgi:hypothetical protein